MERPSGGRGSVGDDIRFLCPRRASTTTCDKDGGMADSAAILSKRDATGCTVMDRFPLPEIFPRAPRPPLLL